MPVLELSADDSKATAAFQKFAQQVGGVEAALDRLTSASGRVTQETQKLTREQASLARAAARIAQDLATPLDQQARKLEEHQRRLQQIAKLTEAGQLSPGMASRARSAEIERYTAPPPEARREQAAIEAARQRVWADTRSEIEKTEARLVELDRLFKGSAEHADTYARAKAKVMADFRTASDRQAASMLSATKSDDGRQAAAARAAAERDKQAAMDRTLQKELELTAAARRTWEQTRTPVEQYRLRVSELSTQMEKGKITQDTYNRAVGQARESLDGAGQSQAAAFGQDAIDRIGALAAGYISYKLVIDQVTKALENKHEVEARAAAGALQRAQAQREALEVLAAQTDVEQAAAVERLRKITSRTKPAEGQEATYRTFAGAMGTSQRDTEAGMGATETALKFSPGNTERARQIATQLPILMRELKSDAQTALGYVVQLQQVGQFKDLSQVIEHAVPAVTQLMRAGATPEEASAAVGAMLAKMPTDIRGRTIGTATMEMATKLGEFLPEKDIREPNGPPRLTMSGQPWEESYGEHEPGHGDFAGAVGELPPGVKRRGTGYTTFRERLAHMHQHPALVEEYLQFAGFSGPERIAAEEFFRGGETAEKYQKLLKDMPERGRLGPLAEEFRVRLGRPGEAKAAKTSRGLKNLSEDLQTSPLGRSHELAGILNADAARKLLQDAGADSIALQAEDYAFKAQDLLSGAAEQRFGGALRRQVQRLRFDAAYTTASGRGAVIRGKPTLTRDPFRLHQADILEKGIEEQLRNAGELRESILNLSPERKKVAEYIDFAKLPEVAQDYRMMDVAPGGRERLLERVRATRMRISERSTGNSMEETQLHMLERLEGGLRDSLRGNPPAQPGDARQPTAGADFSGAVREFRAATTLLAQAAGRIETAGRQSPTLGGEKDV